nr:ricin-type beta-trefoil lectin domain protein [Streptomyces sp. SID5470]
MPGHHRPLPGHGTLAGIWDCNGAANQRFTSTSAGELRVYGGAKCLDVVGAATANGTAVNIWDCNGQSTSPSLMEAQTTSRRPRRATRCRGIGPAPRQPRRRHRRRRSLRRRALSHIRRDDGVGEGGVLGGRRLGVAGLATAA